MNRPRDVVVVGAGPAGLLFATAAARRGLSVAVLERRMLPVDKACGEGILPRGVRVLESLGILDRLSPVDTSPIREIQWVEPDGAVARAALPAPFGLGVRRVALSLALADAARAAGAEVREGVFVSGHRREHDRMVAFGPFGEVAGRVLVAADGLASPVREREGLARRPGRSGSRRFGVRLHYSLAPWAEAVEVHFGDGVEAYVTPAGRHRVGLAFLFERGRGLSSEPKSFDALLAQFPRLTRHLGGAPRETEARGAGPLARGAKARIADRLVLLGDAGGYVDALTGEGLSIAFECAVDLARLLPIAIPRGANRAALAPYESAWRRRFFPYMAYTRTMLGLAGMPTLRRQVVHLLGAWPRPLERLIAAVVS